MAHAGDCYIKQLKASHLGWGNHRYTNSRDIIYGEGYIPLPKIYARSFSIFNSNSSDTGLGYNLFHASSVDGFLENVTLLAQGCSTAGDVFAKQFSVYNNLKVIGAWYASLHATTNNSVKVIWTSQVDMLLEII